MIFYDPQFNNALPYRVPQPRNIKSLSMYELAALTYSNMHMEIFNQFFSFNWELIEINNNKPKISK